MLKTAQTLALWSTLALSQAAWATPICWTFAEGGNGHCYELAQLPGPDVSWDAALTAAQSTTYGNVTGHLATVSSAAEDALLLSLLTAHPEARFAWLGGYQLSPLALPDQGWAWLTGEPWDYTHWASGEPNDYAGVAESYLAMWGVNSGREPGAWNDEGYYVVEGWYLVEFDTSSPPCPPILFVNASAEGANNGRSWTDAYTDLQAALDEATSLQCGPVQIWAAAGVYHPSRSAIPGDRRSATFALTKNLSLYGGFAGGETGLAQRKPFENLTILSGDLDNDDSPTPRQPDGSLRFNGTNSDAVVTADDTDASTVLDGFVVENGDGLPSEYYTGGGLLMTNASPIIANCTFRNNVRAGLMASDNCHVRMVNCRFLGNWWNGVQVSDSPTELVNCAFSGQYTALVASGECRPKLVNCTLAYNDFAIESGWPAQVDLYNSIIWGNAMVSDGYDNVIHPYYSSSQLFSGVVLEEGCIVADPRFVDAAGPDGAYGTLDDDLRLSFSSPCIDAGSNAALPTDDVADLDGDGVVEEELPFDLVLKTRRLDNLARPDTGSGTAPIVDMGAYESDWTPPPPCPHPLFVDASAHGANDGQSWADAYTDLQAALDEAARIDCGPVQVWVAKGIYRPSKAVLPNDRRTAAFQMADELAIYGGFAGGETSLTQRKPFENLTILSGDLDNDDPPWLVSPNSWESTHVGANSYWVVEAKGGGASAVLDGFVLENGDKISDSGLYTGGFGGGLMIDSSSATIANCIFRRNMGAGIGMRPNSNPTIVNCRFLGNFPVGLEAYGCSPAVVNCAFTGHLQALFFDYSQPQLTHCTITGNGMAIGLDGGATPILANCIVWGNESSGYAGETAIQARYSLIQWLDEPYPGEGNIDADPLFVDAPGPDGQYGTLDDDLRLQPQSPCADSGDNVAVPSRDTADLDGDGIVMEELPLDLNLKVRRVDNPLRTDTGIGAPPIVDMGAYEYYTDCNHNGVGDHEDIANGTSQDCNNNGLPDECDVAPEDLTWSAPTSIATGPEPFSIAAGDLNADGRTDLVVGYFGTFNGTRYVGGGVTVLINQGNRAFASANYPTGDRPESIAIADFNEDGKPDLATADSDSQSLSLLAQQPTGWFYRVANIAVEARPQAIAAGNLDGLNRPEFVVGHANGLTVFAYEDGEGYRAIGQYLSGVWVNSVTLADLDRNGTLDIVTASQSTTSVHVLFGRGDRTFGDPVQYVQGIDEAQHVTAADIDGDGDLDLVVSDQGLNGILVMRNTGSGAFDVPQPYEFGDSVSPRATAAADYDGDGDLDLAAADIINPSLLVLRNDGGGHFGSTQIVEAQVAQWFAVQADLDGDGDADVVVVGPPGEGRILWNETKSAASRDCNGNRVPDECDIQAGTSLDANGNGIPDECESPCVAQRVLPPGYVPGQALTSGIEVKPGANVAVYAVEDTPPAGWSVGTINEGGVFDTATGKVKWGPFMDNQVRTLTYETTPPAGAQGSQCFGPGVVSMDGRRAEICGNACVEPCFDHPADTNHDRRLVVDEVTAYAAAWKRGNTWPTPPNPIPIGYMTRAGALWKHGEAYCCDPNQVPPMLWVNCQPATPPAQVASETAAGASATRTVAAGASFFTVVIKATPAGAAAYAIEEAPPAGPDWMVSEITDDGYFDAAANRVRWGPFHDGQDRMLTYRLTPPDTSSLGAFAGILSTDGTDRAVAGTQTTVPLPADLDRDWDVDLDDAKILGSCLTGPAVPLESVDCKKADLDDDGDVDQSDFGLLQRCYGGANVPADSNCMN